MINTTVTPRKIHLFFLAFFAYFTVNAQVIKLVHKDSIVPSTQLVHTISKKKIVVYENDFRTDTLQTNSYVSEIRDKNYAIYTESDTLFILDYADDTMLEEVVFDGFLTERKTKKYKKKSFWNVALNYNIEMAVPIEYSEKNRAFLVSFVIEIKEIYTPNENVYFLIYGDSQGKPNNDVILDSICVNTNDLKVGKNVISINKRVRLNEHNYISIYSKSDKNFIINDPNDNSSSVLSLKMMKDEKSFISNIDKKCKGCGIWHESNYSGFYVKLNLLVEKLKKSQ